MDNATKQRFDRIEKILEKQAVLLLKTNEAIGQYSEAANERMKRVEDNLDALIRAITAEHSNGKGKGKV